MVRLCLFAVVPCQFSVFITMGSWFELSAACGDCVDFITVSVHFHFYPGLL